MGYGTGDQTGRSQQEVGGCGRQGVLKGSASLRSCVLVPRTQKWMRLMRTASIIRISCGLLDLTLTQIQAPSIFTVLTDKHMQPKPQTWERPLRPCLVIPHEKENLIFITAKCVMSHVSYKKLY